MIQFDPCDPNCASRITRKSSLATRIRWPCDKERLILQKRSGANMAAQKANWSKRRVDPNQLDLLDYRPPQKSTSAAPKHSPKPARKRRPKFSGDPQAVLTAKEAAHYLNLSPNTLKAWRRDLKGPAVTPVGARLIGYKPSDLDAFLATNTRR